MAKVYITAIRLSGGSLVRHIVKVWYGASAKYSTSDTEIATSDMADKIDKRTHDAWVQDPRTYQEAEVVVVRPTGRSKYLRTKPDNDPSDNLLSLPQK